jgi:hypothetical protein
MLRHSKRNNYCYVLITQSSLQTFTDYKITRDKENNQIQFFYDSQA